MLKEVRAQAPKAELRFWVDAKFASQARLVLEPFDSTLRVDIITAGKLRRYHHLTLLQHFLWPSLVWHNFVDLCKVGVGFFQSFFKLIAWRPDVIFAKGGYVCLPVCLAAQCLRIPFVIHDSDAHPGLTNRILARYANAIGTGAPLEYYSYPPHKAHYVGIPINEAFHPYTSAEQRAAKKEWGIDPSLPLVVVTGGGLGARRLNNVVIQLLPKLQQIGATVLISGVGQYEELKKEVPKNTPRVQLHAFTNKMAQLIGAADIVVTRAGATTILEVAAAAKPTILVPNAALTGGHQLKNAAVYGDAQAAIVLDEDAMVEKPEILEKAIQFYIEDSKISRSMAGQLHTFAKPHAARDMARLILSAHRKGQ